MRLCSRSCLRSGMLSGLDMRVNVEWRGEVSSEGSLEVESGSKVSCERLLLMTFLEEIS